MAALRLHLLAFVGAMMVAVSSTLAQGAAVSDSTSSSRSSAPSRSPSAAPARGGFNLFTGLLGLHSGSTLPQRSHGIQIIGAGLPKTSTKSLQAALEMFGHRIYDIQSILSTGHTALMTDAFVDNATGKHFGHYPVAKAAGGAAREAAVDTWYDAILNYGATATLDVPMCFLFEELLQRNPDAKVILSWRAPVPGGAAAAAEDWMASLEWTWQATTTLGSPPFSFLISMSWAEVFFQFWSPYRTVEEWWEPAYAPWVHLCERFGWLGEEREEMLTMYHTHAERVRALVPPAQLLEFTAATDGWEPLCRFLELPADACPPRDADGRAQPFPRANSRSALNAVYWVTRVICVVWPFLAVALLAAAVALLRCLWRCLLCRSGGKGEKTKFGKAD